MAEWKGIVGGERLDLDQFKDYVQSLLAQDVWAEWEPQFIVLHNTQGITTPSGLSGSYIRDMEQEYRGFGWSGGPHLFVDSKGVWLFTPLWTPGVHANSWNGVSIGIEMEGDYDKEPFNSGRGLLVQHNAVAAIAILSAALGLDPKTMRLHRENPQTTHHCPGDNVDKAAFIQKVYDYLEKQEDKTGESEKEADMDISPEGLEFLKREEGCVLHAYKDQAGFLTIGVGHLLTEAERLTGVLPVGTGVYWSKGITQTQALELLRMDLTRFVVCVNQVKVELSQNQFDALVSFAFNVGTGAFEGSTLLALLNRGEYGSVPTQLRRWHKAGGKSGVLSARREREIKLWEEPNVAVHQGPAGPEPSEAECGEAGPAVVSPGAGPSNAGGDVPGVVSSGPDFQGDLGNPGSPGSGAGNGVLTQILTFASRLFSRRGR